jgi:hypothetical protein
MSVEILYKWPMSYRIIYSLSQVIIFSVIWFVLGLYTNNPYALSYFNGVEINEDFFFWLLSLLVVLGVFSLFEFFILQIFAKRLYYDGVLKIVSPVGKVSMVLAVKELIGFNQIFLPELEVGIYKVKGYGFTLLPKGLIEKWVIST